MHSGVTNIEAKKSSSWQQTLAEHATRLHEGWVAIRRHLHRHPELSDHERATTEFLANELDRMSLPAHVLGDGRGVTSDLVTSPTVAEGKRIALRGDIDALPIDDDKDVDYRSCAPGVMHACGHDVHATIIVGTMQLMAEMNHRGELPWPVAVRAILQPAEEKATGAKYMIHHHAIRDIDAILALHVDPSRSVGCIGLRDGALTAACDIFQVNFRGQGGHGARPHLTRDPIDACTHWIQSAYRRVSRVTDPHQTVVISVGQLEAGHSANVIPDSASLSGSLRSLDADSRRIALETLEDICESITRETGCEVEMQMVVAAPAVENDVGLVSLMREAAIHTIGAGSIEPIEEPSMGSEDFSYYLEHIPGAMLRLGVAGPQVGQAPLHTSRFDIDERALSIGVKVFAASVIEYFDPSREFGSTSHVSSG